MTSHPTINEERPDDAQGSADELAAQADAVAQLAQLRADRERYGGAPGCVRCDGTLGKYSTRIDLNAGAENGWHGRLCYDCAHELTFWLRRPDQMIFGPPTEPTHPVPRSRHQ